MMGPNIGRLVADVLFAWFISLVGVLERGVSLSHITRRRDEVS